VIFFGGHEAADGLYAVLAAGNHLHAAEIFTFNGRGLDGRLGVGYKRVIAGLGRLGFPYVGAVALV
jgi:hypothetical protein